MHLTKDFETIWPVLHTLDMLNAVPKIHFDRVYNNTYDEIVFDFHSQR